MLSSLLKSAHNSGTFHEAPKQFTCAVGKFTAWLMISLLLNGKDKLLGYNNGKFYSSSFGTLSFVFGLWDKKDIAVPVCSSVMFSFMRAKQMNKTINCHPFCSLIFSMRSNGIFKLKLNICANSIAYFSWFITGRTLIMKKSWILIFCYNFVGFIML